LALCKHVDGVTACGNLLQNVFVGQRVFDQQIGGGELTCDCYIGLGHDHFLHYNEKYYARNYSDEARYTYFLLDSVSFLCGAALFLLVDATFLLVRVSFLVGAALFLLVDATFLLVRVSFLLVDATFLLVGVAK
jgi:hypothetical protein